MNLDQVSFPAFAGRFRSPPGLNAAAAGSSLAVAGPGACPSSALCAHIGQVGSCSASSLCPCAASSDVRFIDAVAYGGFDHVVGRPHRDDESDDQNGEFEDLRPDGHVLQFSDGGCGGGVHACPPETANVALPVRVFTRLPEVSGLRDGFYDDQAYSLDAPVLYMPRGSTEGRVVWPDHPSLSIVHIDGFCTPWGRS